MSLDTIDGTEIAAAVQTESGIESLQSGSQSSLASSSSSSQLVAQKSPSPQDQEKQQTSDTTSEQHVSPQELTIHIEKLLADCNKRVDDLCDQITNRMDAMQNKFEELERSIGELVQSAEEDVKPASDSPIKEDILFSEDGAFSESMASTAQEIRLSPPGPTEVANHGTMDTPENPVLARLTMDHIKALTNLNEIQECLRQLEMEETTIDEDLDELLAEHEELEACLDKLEVLEPQLGALQEESKSLVSIIVNTAGLAEGISAKVRQLDLEQSRVQIAIKHVDDVQELKFCISGIQRALDQMDYEDAARHMHKALGFDRTILEGSFAEIAVPSVSNPEYPTVVLDNAKSKLLEIISTEFENAVERQSEEDITRYFKLFPLLGEEQVGLDKYSKFVCAIVSGKAQASLVAPAKTPTFYADSLIRLFESIAIIVDQHQPVVERHYGPGKMLRVIQRLQEESDARSRKILEAFEDEREIARKINDIKSLREAPKRSNLQHVGPIRNLTPQPGGPNSQQSLSAPDIIDPRELDIILNEMVLVSQRTHIFNRFLESRAKSEMELLEKEDSVDATSVDKRKNMYNENGLLRVSGLTGKVEEVMDHYLIMEEFFLRRSVDKAMKINEYDYGSHTSSCVDDVFYILKKTISRAVYTSNVDCLAAMINFIQRALEQDYIAVFHKSMTTVFSNGDTKDARFQYMLLLNNVSVSIDYLEKLTAEIEQDCVSTISSLSEHALVKAKTVLSGLSTSSTKFRQILRYGIDELFDRTIKPRLRPLLLEAYRDIKYVVTDEEYAEQESTNSFVNRFMSGLDGLVEPFKSTLTEDNYNHIITSAVTSLCRTWEKMIFQSKFNKMGAIRFDKDLRAVGYYMVNLTSFPLREKLTRLNQMAMLLDLEELEDLYEIWGNNAGAITWRLTDAEVRRVLSSRIDFRPEDVAALQL